MIEAILNKNSLKIENKLIIYILVALSILFILFVVIYLIQISIKRRNPFNKVFKDYKQIEMSIVINLNENKVEKYYAYDQFHRSETISLEEFYLRVCDYNMCQRLEFWLNKIKEGNNTSRLELAMYDENNEKRIYKAELERYDADNNCYYLYLKDTTDTPEIIKRVNKVGNNNNIDEFYDKANRVLQNRKEGEKYYLVAIKYKEYNDIRKTIKSSEYLSLLEAYIYARLNNRKGPNDILCQCNDGVILLFTYSLMSAKKTKKVIKKMITHETSGIYNVSKKRYGITLIAGISLIRDGEILTAEKKIEAEEAANTLSNYYMSNEKIRFYDATLANKKNEELILKARVQKIVEENDFDYIYTKLFNVADKKQNGFYVDFALKGKDNISKDEFIKMCRDIESRKPFYSNLFNEIINHNLYANNTYYVSINYQDIDKVMEAYSSNELLRKIDIYFCIVFNNISKKSYSEIMEIEKQIHYYKKNLNVHFGINYDSLQTIYLNENIYNQMELVLFSGKLVSSALDTYSNGLLVDMYVKIAKKYHHNMIACDVSYSTTYELFFKSGISKMGGKIFFTKTDSHEIVDKLLLQKLNNIEKKTY